MSDTDLRSRASAEENAGFFSRVFIQWPSVLVKIGAQRPLELSDSLEPQPYDDLDRATPVFEQAYAARRTGKDGLRRALYDTYRRRFWLAALIFLAYQLISTVGPLVVRELIQWFEQTRQGALWTGLAIAAGLGLFHLVESISHKHQWSEVWKTAHSINALLRGQVLRKYLRMDRGARLAHPTGEVITHASSDARKVGLSAFVHMSWAVPLGIVGSCAILLVLMGWAGLVGIAVLVAGLALSHVANERVYALVPQIRDANGARIGLVSEFVGAMRTLRSHGWESYAEQSVTRERDTLNRLLVRRQRRLATLYLVNAAAPVLMITTTLVTYAAFGNELHASDVFSAIAVLTVMRSQLPELVRYLDMRNEWRVAYRKMTAFLDAPESTEQAASGSAPSGTVTITGGSFAWPSKDGDPAPALHDIDLDIAPGELVCVLGRVGSGKSALLGAMAGMMRTASGAARVGGTSVYLPQRAWIMQGTVAENIRCYSPDDPQRYAAVVRATALEADLAAMPARDDTVIGERGTNLSGGQRQRIALARAAYEDADVYLVDDPTSAVDDAVAASIMDNLFAKLLAGRTRVVATHRLDFARRADRVVVLDGGRVLAVGTFEQIAASMPDLLPAIAATEPPAEQAASAEADEADVEEFDEDAVRSGKVITQTYRQYLRVLTPGFLVVVLIGLALLGQAMLGGSSFWLGEWTAHPGQDTLFYACGFAAIALVGLALDRTLFSFGFSRGVKAGMHLHAAMLRRVLRAPLSFFDRNPSGRVLSRFSADMETIDLELPGYSLDTLAIAVGLLIPWIALAITSPLTLVFAPIVALIYLRWQRRTRSSTAEASRLSKQAKEPMLSLLNEVIDGVTSIEGRAVRLAGYEAAYRASVRTAHRTDYTVNSLSRHFNLRLDLMGAAILFGSAALLVVQGASAGFAGVGISFVYMLTETLAMSLITIYTMDLALTSFERVHDYTNLPEERAGGSPAPQGWPSAGDVRFEKVSLRYNDGGPLALDEVSFHVPAGAKVGIVGRTGSGKSSLFSSLLRFVEIEQGRIVVDGVDVGTLRLEELRGRVAIIPQDPVLLPGTLRDNLDPVRVFSDGEIEASLKKVGLADKLLALPSGLSHPVSGGNAQLSAGERQLFCLARALLDRAKVVLIDEATSSLDAETDAQIQRTLESELAGATVLTIAHRRGTLSGADQVITMEAGKVAQVVTADGPQAAPGPRRPATDGVPAP
ncbi:ATP-binding cassette domain-containing protein [Catellatospora sp. KI3]|uniref:ATP-binding cassette domain-containing protein n=1 Tax=Catellatospora sp. KI3 TaxID=3041620 RepID=UPI0024831E83|nr:ATP-binding cassette domain-containing protein [Catellatospora sp. KI3]MDI1463734.1 ATP-binding cassette domain-containing protein [Catellatospora sp. KI3]